MSNLTATTHTLLSNSALMSSITNHVKTYFIRSFPKDFFKYVYMRNSNPSITEQSLNFEQKLVKPKPALALNLVFETQDTTFNGEAFHFGVSNIRQYAFDHRFIYDGIMRDDTLGLYISAFQSRTRAIFEVGIKVESELKAASVNRYMEGYLGINRPFYINNAFVETPLPNGVINKLIVSGGFDLTTTIGRSSFHEWLSLKSDGNITFKKNLSTGNWVYYYRYATNILCRIPDRIQIQKNMENKSIKDAILTFTFDIEFGSHMNFVTESLGYPAVAPPPQNTLPTFDQEFEIAYNYTVQQPYTMTLGDKKLIHTLRVVTDDDVLSDTTIFDDGLAAHYMRYFNYVNELVNEVGSLKTVEDYIAVQIFKDDDILDAADFTIDWNAFTLKLNNPFINFVYTMTFYINLEHFQKFILAWESTAYGQIKPEREILQQPNE